LPAGLQFNFWDLVVSTLNHSSTNLKEEMNVFVLNTGRCGSTTFIIACSHITNFTCAHESRTSLLGEDRFDYPENHIEADNRLSWLLGRLEKTYGDNAIYVHLKRNDDETARSYVRRFSGGIMRAYRRGGILMGLKGESDPMAVALDYCHTVNSNIELFLKDKTHKMEINLESIDRDFPAFWKLIGAEGEISAALTEFNKRYHAAKVSQNSRRNNLITRILLKFKRLAIKLPRFIRDA
jgi:hypothetical protein